MEVYLVGGAIRDQLLGVANEQTEKDWVVVGARASELLALGYQQVGKDFPVFLHPETKEEYALARLERKTAKGYTGFEFDTSASVSLEQDLSRRDLTINAMAQNTAGELIDPFDGQSDLQQGLLRHVSAAFVEDPVRILRVARFAARFKDFGFKVAHETHHLMQAMVASGEVDALTPERVFKELEKSLNYATPSPFFKVLSACGAYERVFAPLATLGDKHQNGFTHLDHLPVSAPVKFALWLKDERVEDIKQLCKTLRCSKAYGQYALMLSQWHGFLQDFQQKDPEQLLDFFLKTDAMRRQERFVELLQAYALLEVDTKSLQALWQQLLDIDIASLDQDNIAQAIYQQRLQVVQSFLHAT